jgi:hypothetical protein
VQPSTQDAFKHSFSKMLSEKDHRLKVNWVDSDVVWSVVLYVPPERVDASRVLMSIPNPGAAAPPGG